MSPLKRLESWFLRQCDGNWEHEHVIKIENLDNPGWWITIQISDTELSGAPYEPISIDEADGTWLETTKSAASWEASCDVGGLERALLLFVDWADAQEQRRPRG